MSKIVFYDLVEFIFSMIFFGILSIVLMLIFIVSFKRKDDSLLPG